MKSLDGLVAGSHRRKVADAMSVLPEPASAMVREASNVRRPALRLVGNGSGAWRRTDVRVLGQPFWAILRSSPGERHHSHGAGMDSWHLACCRAPWEHSIRPDVTS